MIVLKTICCFAESGHSGGLNKGHFMIKEFLPKDITLLDEYYTSVTQKDVDFLNTFNADRLLYNFRVTAGVPDKKADGPYSGWENTRIGGHTMGHYLAAVAQALARGYGNCKGKDGISLLNRFEYIINSLEECQTVMGTGFVFGATMADPSKPELQFDLLEQGIGTDTWVPWYTTHKLINGFVESYKSAADITPAGRTALRIAQKFAEWIYCRVKKWDSDVQKKVLSVEYGGMNDCLYELYKCSVKENYQNADHILFAAHSFDEEELFEKVLESYKNGGVIPDALNNRHANTTIPKFAGVANRCTLGTLFADNGKYLEYAEAFFDIVVSHHTYITGGNSECEHFGKADILDAERSNSNCETCNTHNMLKFSRTLFMLTGKKKYADYYENTFLNAIMASVNGTDGMTLYFQPMTSGCFKIFCNPDVNKNYFWCCTGTGLENFTKLGDSFYFHDDGTLFVNQYVSSSVYWDQYDVTVTQKTDLPVSDKVFVTVECGGKQSDLCSTEADGGKQKCLCSTDDDAGKQTQNPFTLALRIPDWISGDALVKVNGADCSAKTAGSPANQITVCKKDGYILLSNFNSAQTKTQIELTFPMCITAANLADNKNAYAFKYGPLVLAAHLGYENKMIHQIGVLCDVCQNKIIRGKEMLLTGNYGGTNNLKPLSTEKLFVEQGVDSFMQNINEHMVRSDTPEQKLRFVLRNTSWPKEFVFTPYYLFTEERYGIYWIFTDNRADLEQSDEEQNETLVQGIGVGYGAQTEGNSETFPFLEETGSGSCADPNALTRYAKAGGSFSYLVNVSADKTNFVECSFFKEDNGKTIIIRANGMQVSVLTLNFTGEDEKYEERFMISSEAIMNAPVSKENKNFKQIRLSFESAGNDDSARIAAPLKIICVQ